MSSELFSWDICALHHARRAFLLFKGGKPEGTGALDDIADCVRGATALPMTGRALGACG